MFINMNRINLNDFFRGNQNVSNMKFSKPYLPKESFSVFPPLIELSSQAMCGKFYVINLTQIGQAIEVWIVLSS